MEGCLTSLVTREMQIKITMKSCFTPTRMPVLKKTVTSVDKDLEQLHHTLLVEKYNGLATLGKSWRFLRRVNTEFPSLLLLFLVSSAYVWFLRGTQTPAGQSSCSMFLQRVPSPSSQTLGTRLSSTKTPVFCLSSIVPPCLAQRLLPSFLPEISSCLSHPGTPVTTLSSNASLNKTNQFL